MSEISDKILGGSEPAAAAGKRGVLVPFEVVVAVLITLAAGGISIFMPELVATGGILAAQNTASLSPVFFPRLALGILAVISLGYVVQLVVTFPKGSGFVLLADEAIGYARVALVTVVIVIYAAIVELLGFIFSTMLVGAFLGVFLGLRNPLSMVPGVIIFPIGVRFLFERLLLIALPGSDIAAIAAIEEPLMRFLVRLLLPS